MVSIFPATTFPVVDITPAMLILPARIAPVALTVPEVTKLPPVILPTALTVLPAVIERLLNKLPTVVLPITRSPWVNILLFIVVLFVGVEKPFATTFPAFTKNAPFKLPATILPDTLKIGNVPIEVATIPVSWLPFPNM